MVTDVGTLRFSPSEEWVEYGPPEARKRIGFHDYAAVYAVPGLYEAMFYDKLGMRSTFEVVTLFGEVLERESLDPASQRVIDFGAGNGLGGQRLRELGIGHLRGLDVEPMARVAAERDHPGVYDDYLVGDLATWDDSQLADLTAMAPTALVALSAIGIGHVPPTVLDRVIRCLPGEALFGFAIHPRLMPGSDDPEGIASGFPDFMASLMADSDMLAQTSYLHRVRPDGSEDLAIAFVGRLR